MPFRLKDSLRRGGCRTVRVSGGLDIACCEPMRAELATLEASDAMTLIVDLLEV